MSVDQESIMLRKYKPQDLPYFKELILQKINAVQKEITRLQQSVIINYEDYRGGSSPYAQHIADGGSDAQARENARMLAQRQQRYLRNLQAALERIENGTYGYCRDTGEPIEYARLQAVPHATLSIKAKKARENNASENLYQTAGN